MCEVASTFPTQAPAVVSDSNVKTDSTDGFNIHAVAPAKLPPEQANGTENVIILDNF